ncbi:DEHA2E23804p [Debaryomyces hansenii CBS767]|uniref:DEHA2E23804p n=1 Tax=Debaryomyces hansenii (strain ATCC 36239 / CBS 767 / BCRC 21394 / JCM 1990 / NBRC 0083 / IGC 2968) TaxID=284592 RepID=Q6BN85_DEBHA|nr:DEHA2E23804p [Debaryomyces hansenii CBS767]CAG88620.2 DEHA2E23804p [Debaryomyces hansenii CBS767]|eukprot:XP_460335.2 DEHA2E23804p [Debaryomyces hansenii CBS767]
MQKKHSRSYEEDNEDSYDLAKNGKRIKLDNLLQELSLDDDDIDVKSKKATHSFIESKVSKSSQQTDYVVNPSINLKSYSVFKKSSSPQPTINSPNINSYVMEKLVQHFHTLYNSKSALIQWYKPHLILSYHFENWVIRLFNRFIRKYNKRSNGIPIKKFKFYSKIMNLINSKEISFTYNDLLLILEQENKLEELKLNRKRKIRDYNKEKDSDTDEKDDKTFENIKYNYWDTLRGVNKDFEMIDELSKDNSDTDSPKVYEVVEPTQSYQNSEDSDIDMETDATFN